MSISSAQSALKQIEREIERLSKTKSDAEAKAAACAGPATGRTKKPARRGRLGIKGGPGSTPRQAS